MALKIVEFFGRSPLDPLAASDTKEKRCPFVGWDCIKPNHGACSLSQINGDPIIACPNRLYADDFLVLRNIAAEVFGKDCKLVESNSAKTKRADGVWDGRAVHVFGRYKGQELALPKPSGSKSAGSYYVDWILARISMDGNVEQFTAVEVQTIDTTGNYKEQAVNFFAGKKFSDKQGRNPGFSDAGMNWENVSKRILPQLIYKGHVLRREAKCSKGLYFVCPQQVLDRVRDRLGNRLQAIHPSFGTITFQPYSLSGLGPVDRVRTLVRGEPFTTTVDQIALAFSSPMNLPEQNVYESAILEAFHK